MTRLVSSLLACLVGALPLGCVTLNQPRAQEGLTTGDKLRAIDAALRGDSSWERGCDEPETAAHTRARMPDWCKDLRARLVGNPPSMYAEVYAPRYPDEQPLSVDGYAGNGPGLYPPVNRERADLMRAHAAGLLSDAELAELLALLEMQAKRPSFRRKSESSTVFITDSLRLPPLGSHSGTPANAENRRAFASREWLRKWFDSYGNIERVAGAELSNPDPNAPSETTTRGWRNPDFWVDPKPPSTP